MSKEAMKLALGKIKSARDCHANAVDTLLFEAEEVLEEALAEQPAQQEPVAYIRKDQLQKAAQSPMLCEVTPEPRQDRIGIYTSPQAQPAQQEPVAWLTQARCFVDVSEFTEAEAKLFGWKPLYTSPQPAQRTWVGLTDEERDALIREFNGLAVSFYKAVEAKLKEKNT